MPSPVAVEGGYLQVTGHNKRMGFDYCKSLVLRRSPLIKVYYADSA
jgi:hypothetical protein